MASIRDLERLAERGDIQAQYELGIAYKNRGEYQLAKQWLDSLARQVDSPAKLEDMVYILSAMRNLALMYTYLECSCADPKKAFELYSDIRRKHPRAPQAYAATVELGKMYYKEEYINYGVPHDPGKGEQLINEWVNMLGENQLSEQTHCADLGLMYFRKNDKAKAVYYLEYAVLGNYYESKQELDKIRELLSQARLL